MKGKLDKIFQIIMGDFKKTAVSKNIRISY